MTENPTHKFALIFAGPADDSVETSRSIKATLLADADLEISEVQKALSEAPYSIRTAATEGELKPILAALKRANALVSIVPLSSSSDSDESEEMEFEMDLSEKKAAPKPRVWNLDVPGDEEPTVDVSNPEGEVKSVVSESSIETVGPELPKDSFPAPGSATASLFSLEGDDDELSVTAPTNQAESPPETKDAEGAAPSQMPQFDLSLSIEEDSTPLIDSAVKGHLPDEEKEEEHDLTLAPLTPAPPPTPPPPPTSFSLDADEEVKPKVAPPVKEVQEKAPITKELKELKESASDLPEAEDDSSSPDDESPTSQDEPPADGDDEGFENFEPFIPSPKTTSVWKEIALPVIILGPLLIALNLLYQKYGSEDKPVVVMGEFSGAPDLSKTPVAPTATPTPAPDRLLLGRNETSTDTVELDCTASAVAIFSCKFNLTTPEPPASTREEIVRDIPRRPWISKIESDQIEISDGVGKGIARAYIEYKDQKDRIVVPVELRAIAKSQGKYRQLEIDIKTDQAINLSQNVPVVEPKKEIGSYTVGYKRTVALVESIMTPIAEKAAKP